MVALGRAVRRELVDRQRRRETARQRLLASRPSEVLARRRQELAEWRRRLPAAALQHLADVRHHLTRLNAALRLLSPENILDRGYSITFEASSGRVVRSPDEVSTGDPLRTRLKGGTVESVVT